MKRHKQLKEAPRELPGLPAKPAITGIHLIVYSNCPPEKEFVTMSGEHLKNLFELSESLAKIDNNIFGHHVNSQRNDFANWVGDVFNEKELANAFRKSHTREQHEIKLLKHLLGKILEHEKKN
ncbi:MAG: hypothetical protein EPN86_04805 [Nanoarchaeota archaeon]|nr:MAG: hypothetical protein EPN86_04805 [Nanoarchaeota archaeon]